MNIAFLTGRLEGLHEGASRVAHGWNAARRHGAYGERWPRSPACEGRLEEFQATPSTVPLRSPDGAVRHMGESFCSPTSLLIEWSFGFPR